MTPWILGITWSAALAAMVWAVLQGCDVVREHYLMPRRMPWPPVPLPWPGRLDWVLMAATMVLMVVGIAWVPLVVAVGYLTLASVCLRLGHHVRRWWATP